MDASFAVALLLTLHLHRHLLVRAAMDSCYDEEEGASSRCMPKFENLSFNRTVVASNVCGSPPEDYCMQTGSTRSCHRCDASDPERSHNTSLLTDFHRSEENTWWQSQSMYYGIQHPNSVNLTLHLGKSTAARPRLSLTPRTPWFDFPQLVQGRKVEGSGSSMSTLRIQLLVSVPITLHIISCFILKCLKAFHVSCVCRIPEQNMDIG